MFIILNLKRGNGERKKKRVNPNFIVSYEQDPSGSGTLVVVSHGPETMFAVEETTESIDSLIEEVKKLVISEIEGTVRMK